MTTCRIYGFGAVVAFAALLATTPIYAECAKRDSAQGKGQNEQVVAKMVEKPKTEPDGSRQVAEGSAKPRENRSQACPEGEEPTRDGKCVKADIEQTKPVPGEQKVTANSGTSNQADCK